MKATLVGLATFAFIGGPVALGYLIDGDNGANIGGMFLLGLCILVVVLFGANIIGEFILGRFND